MQQFNNKLTYKIARTDWSAKYVNETCHKFE